MRLDLHIHTTASDGTWSPKVLIRNLLDNDIGIFSVTDHDTTENSSLMADELDDYDLRYIVGVEVSSTYPSVE